jgi:hypothetical protein
VDQARSTLVSRKSQQIVTLIGAASTLIMRRRALLQFRAGYRRCSVGWLTVTRLSAPQPIRPLK